MLAKPLTDISKGIDDKSRSHGLNENGYHRGVVSPCRHLLGQVNLTIGLCSHGRQTKKPQMGGSVVLSKMEVYLEALALPSYIKLGSQIAISSE